MIEQTHGGSALPTTVGIGLRLQHFSEIGATRPAIAWLEVHPENYFVGDVGPTRLDWRAATTR
jgi:uncharacterized protein (UPF0276 family)